MFNMLVHCESLGCTPSLSNVQNSFKVEKTHPIEHVWAWVGTCSERNGGINNLLIASHGVYSKMANQPGESKGSARGMVGGFGIALGSGITKDNIFLSARLKGKVKNIYLFVCGGSAQPPAVLEFPDDPDYGVAARSVGPAYATNNRQLCFDMAAHTEANVYASASQQAFVPPGYISCSFNFGAWEGKVEKFSPYGDAKDVTARMHKFGAETGDE